MEKEIWFPDKDPEVGRPSEERHGTTSLSYEA